MYDVVFEPGLFESSGNAYTDRVNFNMTAEFLKLVCDSSSKDKLQLILPEEFWYSAFCKDNYAVNATFRQVSPEYVYQHPDGITQIVEQSFYSEDFGLPYMHRIAHAYLSDSGVREPEKILLITSGHENQARKFIRCGKEITPQCIPKMECETELRKIVEKYDGGTTYRCNNWPKTEDQEGADDFYNLISRYIRDKGNTAKYDYRCTSRFLKQILDIPDAGKEDEQLTKCKFLTAFANRIVYGPTRNEKMEMNTRGAKNRPKFQIKHFRLSKAERVFFYEQENVMIIVDYVRDHLKNEETIPNVNPDELIVFEPSQCVTVR